MLRIPAAWKLDGFSGDGNAAADTAGSTVTKKLIRCKAGKSRKKQSLTIAGHCSIQSYTARSIYTEVVMLVLSRKESQRIRLGDSIVITIVKISGDKVRVGIEAPSNVLVLRDELEPRESATPSAPVDMATAAEP